MFTIDVNMCSLDGNIIVTEASTIGLQPGQWPDFIAVTKATSPEGRDCEGLLFGPTKKFLEGVTIYQSRTGFAELHIIND